MNYFVQLLHKVRTGSTDNSSAVSLTSNNLSGLNSLQMVRASGVSGHAFYAPPSDRVAFGMRVVLLCAGLNLPAAYASHDSEHPLTDEEWKDVMAKVSMLDEAALIPSLLPIIMRNRDALELSDVQMERLYRWRRDNYVHMVNVMNEVIEKRVQFRIASLSPDISAEELIAFQDEIHRLERELLQIRLTCRAIVMETFTAEQWETFEFIAADDPKLASLISQGSSTHLLHNH